MPHPQRTRILIAADIFGVTPELGQLARALGANGTLASPQPYSHSFRSEAAPMRALWNTAAWQPTPGNWARF